MVPEPERTAQRVVDDIEALRAFVHPLRLRLLSLLRVDGPATASELARRIGESSGSTSYHLRQLARFGFVEDDPAQTSKRERLWKAAHRSTRVPAETFVGDPERWDVVNRLAHQQVEQWLRAANAFLADPQSWSPDWIEAATTDDARLRITPERQRALNTEIENLITRYQEESRGQPGTEIVTLFYGAVPVRDKDL
jgi:DNA-binding transcriptional ArsR family regulator